MKAYERERQAGCLCWREIDGEWTFERVGTCPMHGETRSQSVEQLREVNAQMLAALKVGLELLEHYGACEQVDAMRAAIATAEGR